jgi:hypothetical protein
VESFGRVTVVDSGGVKIEKANHAAQKVQQELRQRRDVVSQRASKDKPDKSRMFLLGKQI